MSLEALLDPIVDLAPTWEEYRGALRAAAAAGRSADDPAVAAQLAAPARRLALSAVQIRTDALQFVKLRRLEGEFDADELSRLKEELEERARPDMLFSTTGFEVHRRGYVEADDDGSPYICERDRRFSVLQQQYDSTTGKERLAVVAEMQPVRDEADRLAVARRQIEEQTIAMLNLKDRLAGFRRGNRRLFPSEGD